MVSSAVGIGMIAAFIFTELTGLSPGGLIVPGYLAFFLHLPGRVVITFLVAIGTYAVLLFLSNYLILFGRRRFMAAVLLGYILGWAAQNAVGWFPGLMGSDLRVIGYIVPGLIANDMFKQGVYRTIAGTLLVSAVVRMVLVLFLW